MAETDGNISLVQIHRISGLNLRTVDMNVGKMPAIHSLRLMR